MEEDTHPESTQHVQEKAGVCWYLSGPMHAWVNTWCTFWKRLGRYLCPTFQHKKQVEMLAEFPSRIEVVCLPVHEHPHKIASSH